MPETLLDLLAEDGHHLKRAGAKEYAGACPWCGGNDRFVVWPYDNPEKGGRFWCRQCKRTDTAVGYLVEKRGLTMKEALDRLGISGPAASRRVRLHTRRIGESIRRSNPEAADWKPDPLSLTSAVIDPDTWHAKAEALTTWASEQLTPDSLGAAYLSSRGIGLEAARSARLGWIPQDVTRPLSDFGLEASQNGPQSLYVPSGVCIPCQRDGRVWRVRVRRIDRKDYRHVPGSGGPCLLLGCDPGRPVVVVESELDAVLLRQDAGELVGVVALGSAQAKPDASAAAILRAAPVVLVALDNDSAGGKAAWTWWHGRFPGCFRLPPIDAKDPGDMKEAGIELADWIQAGLSIAQGGGGNVSPLPPTFPAPEPASVPHPEESPGAGVFLRSKKDEPAETSGYDSAPEGEFPKALKGEPGQENDGDSVTVPLDSAPEGEFFEAVKREPGQENDADPATVALDSAGDVAVDIYGDTLYDADPGTVAALFEAFDAAGSIEAAADLLPSDTRRAYVSELQFLKTAHHAGPGSARPAFVAFAIIGKWTPQDV